MNSNFSGQRHALGRLIEESRNNGGETKLAEPEAWRRLDLIEKLSAAWAAEHAGHLPAGTGSTWWPVEHINAALASAGEPWRIELDGETGFSYLDL